MKVLVVFYSRSGHTRAVGQQIAAMLYAAVEEIQDLENRKGFVGCLRSGFEGVREKPANIRPPVEPVSEYDLVVIGTPVWAGKLASPTRAYLEQVRGGLTQAAFFCTSGGGGYQAVLDAMEQIAAVPSVASVELKQAEVKTGNLEQRLSGFCDRLRQED